MLHAFPLDASQWDHQVAALSGRHRCLRPDFWGCGRSPGPPAGAALEDYASAVLLLLGERGVEDFAVVGLSLGGYVAFELLRQAPERIRALVLADTRATADTEAVRAEREATASRALREDAEFLVEPTVERLLSPASREEPHVTDPLRGRIRGWSGEGIAAACQAMAGRVDSVGLLADVRSPALVITGEQDATSPAAMMAEMAAAIPGAVHRIIPGAGHLSNLEQPSAFSGLLEAFLGS